MKTVSLSDLFVTRQDQFEYADDFFWFISPHMWTTLAADGGVTAHAQSDARNGVLSGATGATDNNEVAVRSTNEVLLFGADRVIVFESRIQFTEANTDDANVAVGMADAASANLLGDDGAGDAINSSGALIFKIDGETKWRCAVEINGTIKETLSAQTAGGASYQTLKIIAKPVDATNIEVTYFLDDLPLTDDVYNRPIKHLIAYASSTEMRVVAGYVKAGGANSETLLIDYCQFACVRN